MRFQKSLKSNTVKRIEKTELKSDFRRIALISVVSIVLSIITYRFDTCFEETLFCTVLAIISTVIIGILYFIRKSRTRS